MLQILLLIREVNSSNNQELYRKWQQTGEPHTWATFYPFQQAVNRETTSDQAFHFTGGEAMIVEDDGRIVLHTLINTPDGRSLLHHDSHGRLAPLVIDKPEEGG